MAETDGKIYIYITDKRMGDEPGPGPKPEPKPDGEKETLFGHWAKAKILSEVKQLATQAVNFGISHYGQFTGDYQTQRDIQASKAAISSMMSIVGAAVAGFKLGGGPAGAVLGASIAVINQGVSLGTQTYEIWRQGQVQNHNISILRERSGIDALTNGSRTGN